MAPCGRLGGGGDFFRGFFDTSGPLAPSLHYSSYKSDLSLSLVRAEKRSEGASANAIWKLPARAMASEPPPPPSVRAHVSSSRGSDMEDFAVEIDEEMLRAEIHDQTTAAWSTNTFACLSDAPSCALALLCPCVQYGSNMRLALGHSCLKWTLVWLIPMGLLLALYRSQIQQETSTLSQVADVARKQAVSAAKHAAIKLQRQAQLQKEMLDSVGTVSHHSTYATTFIVLAMVLVGLIGCLGRSKLRRRYGIKGTLLGDFLCHCWCHPCSLARESREIRQQQVRDILSTSNMVSEEIGDAKDAEAL